MDKASRILVKSKLRKLYTTYLASIYHTRIKLDFEVMSYNGIGLHSAKGSSTSGHIERSLADREVRNSVKNYLSRQRKDDNNKIKVVKKQQKDDDLIKRTIRHDVEVRVSELRDRLEDEGDVDDNTIEQRCNELRKQLLSELAHKERCVKTYVPRKNREGKAK